MYIKHLQSLGFGGIKNMHYGFALYLGKIKVLSHEKKLFLYIYMYIFYIDKILILTLLYFNFCFLLKGG